MKHIFLLSLCFTVLTSCWRKSKVDVTLTSIKEATFMFKASESIWGGPIGMLVHVTGTCTDTIYVQDVALPPGNIDSTLRFDWYSDTVYLRLHAHRLVTGKLHIVAEAK
jgi:hypothetical protein